MTYVVNLADVTVGPMNTKAELNKPGLFDLHNGKSAQKAEYLNSVRFPEEDKRLLSETNPQFFYRVQLLHARLAVLTRESAIYPHNDGI